MVFLACICKKKKKCWLLRKGGWLLYYFWFCQPLIKCISWANERLSASVGLLHVIRFRTSSSVAIHRVSLYSVMSLLQHHVWNIYFLNDIIVGTFMRGMHHLILCYGRANEFSVSAVTNTVAYFTDNALL
jgi:hypothetical protein